MVGDIYMDQNMKRHWLQLAPFSGGILGDTAEILIETEKAGIVAVCPNVVLTEGMTLVLAPKVCPPGKDPYCCMDVYTVQEGYELPLFDLKQLFHNDQ